MKFPFSTAAALISVFVAVVAVATANDDDTNSLLRHREHKDNAQPNLFQPKREQQLVASTDGFESSHAPSAPDGENGGRGHSNEDSPGDMVNVVVRLDRRAGSSDRRMAGINALRAAASGRGRVYLDRSYVPDDDDRRTGLMDGIMAASVPAASMGGLARSGLYEVVEVDHSVEAFGWRDGASGTRRRRRLVEDVPWGIPAVQADLVAGNPSNRIKVCVADTGLWLGHEDLPQNVPDDVDGTDSSIFTGDDMSWDYDGHGHGTHCSGTVGAIGNNAKGVVGVFNETADWTLQVGKALSAGGSGSGTTVMEAVENCVLAGAKVVSLSLGCTGSGCYSTTEDDFYADLYLNHDVLLVAAAGNSGNNAYSYPASYSALVSVAATDVLNETAGFSQANDQVEVAGPGVGVMSTLPFNSYASWSGTSMATPHVAAVAAKIWSHFPHCKNWHIRNALSKSAVHPGAGGDTTYCDQGMGNGIVKAKEMYDLLDALGCGAGGISKDGDNSVSSNMVGGCDQVHETLAPTVSPAPTDSFRPSAVPSDPPTPYPTSSHWPSVSPSSSNKPSQSPSDRPSLSPSASLAPSDFPSSSPTYTPTAEVRSKLSSPTTNSIQIQHGCMFDIVTKTDLTIYNLNISLYTTALTDVTIWTKAGSFWPDKTYAAKWRKAGVARNVRGTGKFADTFILPRYSFEPITVPAGATQAFYLAIPDGDTTNRVSMDNKGSSLHDIWFENADMSVLEGVFKTNWGTFTGGPHPGDQTFRFLGAFHYITNGTRIPTASPTLSVAPSVSEAPSRIAASPSIAPSVSFMPTGQVHSLNTPGGGSKSAYGYMFDLVAKGTYPVRVLNFEVHLRTSQCEYQIYTKAGLSYYGYNQPHLWTLIRAGTLFQTPGSSEDTQFAGFTPQQINPGETRAFFIAFHDCSGSWPLAVDQGGNYSLGSWVEDDNLDLREGIKFGRPLTQENPFGIPFEPFYLCCAPGFGRSYTMSHGSIQYDLVLPPSTPSPTTTAMPSLSPTATVHELEGTPTNYYSSIYGTAFDIEVKNPIFLEGMDIMFKNYADSISLSIYIKPGTHVGLDTNSSAWSLLYTRSNMTWGGSIFTAQSLPDFNKTSLSTGTYGIFIDSGEATQNLYSDTKAEHISGYQTPYVQSQDMDINCGRSKRGWASTYTYTVGFQGSFHYSLDGTRFPTSSPTVSPSSAPSMNCTDDDICTQDRWNSTSETCYYEATECEDNDSCTTDSCDPIVGCSSAAIPNCEALMVPPSSSPTNYNIGAFILDISAPGVFDIAITGFTLTPNTEGTMQRALLLDEAYTPTSSHYRSSSDESKWTEVGTGAVTSPGIARELVLDNPVSIRAGSSRGFALEALGSSSYRAKKNTGLEFLPFVNTSHAALSHSMAVPSLFSGSLNGCYDADELIVKYIVIIPGPSSASPTDSPTQEPTSAPSKSPTSSPSALPTSNPTRPPTQSPTDEVALSGYCSDGSGRCSVQNMTQCDCNNPDRKLIEIKGKEDPFSRRKKARRILCGNFSNQQCTGACTWSKGNCVPATAPPPTLPPTNQPTNSPETPPPTTNPTTEPTRNPTKLPTSHPTDSPVNPAPCTCLSTAFPTSSPSKSPSKRPSLSPTGSPTSEPTAPPTKQPTSPPTNPGPLCVCNDYSTGKTDCTPACGGGVCRWSNKDVKCIPK